MDQVQLAVSQVLNQDVQERPVPPLCHPSDADTDIETLRSVPERFEVRDERTASWVVRRIIGAREYAARVKAWCEVELARAAREEATLKFLFEGQLRDRTQEEIDRRGGRRRSINLPGGLVGFRRTPANFVVTDESVVLLWAKSNCPQAVVQIEKLSKSALKEYVTATGEVPDAGVEIEPPADRFFVR